MTDFFSLSKRDRCSFEFWYTNKKFSRYPKYSISESSFHESLLYNQYLSEK